MTETLAEQVPASPGALLKAAREARDMDESEAADRLHWLPAYVAIIERDDYQALRSPPFARGYVRAYGRLVGVDEAVLLAAFDAKQGPEGIRREERRTVNSRPLDLQSTGVGVVIGLGTLLLLVLVLWWLRADEPEVGPDQPSALEIPASPSNSEPSAQALSVGG